MKYYGSGAFFDEHDESSTSRCSLKINITADSPETFTLSLRVHGWVNDSAVLSINGEVINTKAENGFISITREWKNDSINLCLPSSITFSSLPDMPQLTAFSEGPIVLAALCDKDYGIIMDNDNTQSILTNVAEHTYSTFPWQQSCYSTINQPVNFDFIPLYDITDEKYTVYLTRKKQF